MTLTPGVQAWRRGGGLVRWEPQDAAPCAAPLDIFLRVGGTGPVVLLLHGYPTGSYDWHRLWPELHGQHQLVAPDMLGLGLSAKPARHAYGIADQADLHEWVLQTLGVQRVHLVAHDLGVSVAQEMLARRMETGAPAKALCAVASVTLLNGGVFPETYRPRPIQRVLASPLGGLIGPRVTRERFGQSILPLFSPAHPCTRERVDDFWSLVVHGGGLRVAHRVGRFWKDRLAVRDRLVAPLTAGRWPVQMVNGSADPNSGAHMAARFRELVPGARIAALDSVGHWPQLDVPRRVAALVAEFVREHEHRV